MTRIRAAGSSDTLRAIALMTVAMAGFATADMLIKLSADTLPPSQVLTILGIGGAIFFAIVTRTSGLPLVSSKMKHPAILARAGAEIVATMGFLMALTLLPFATASSILQFTPLLVTLGAAALLKEQVSWRRWSAIFAGLIGVLIILNPFSATTSVLTHPDTSLGAILALVGVVGLAGRDLSTRFIPADTPNLQVATWGFLAVILAGLMLSLLSDPWQTPTPKTALMLLGMITFGCIGYFAVTAAMRIGDVSAVAPFRYTRIVFAFALAVIIFGETLTLRTIIGAGLIVAAGLYVWLRERNRGQSLPHPTATR